MNEIKAIIKPFMLEQVVEALREAVGLHAKGEPSGSNLQDYAIATSVKKIETLLNIQVG